MTDVSHELGALRHVVDSSLSSKVAMFNNHVQQHQQSQLLNPFSGSASGRASPKPAFSKEEYGKPLAGSLTEMRGQKANMHVLKEMLELCQIIDSEGYAVNDEPHMRVIPFGELFNIYNYISDKVVGILLRARKHKLVDFEGEMLFQRRDDDVPVFLLKPIAEIRKELEQKIDEIKRGVSPAPLATTLLQDKGAHQQKLQESTLSMNRRTPSRSPSPSPVTRRVSASAPVSKAPSPAPESALSNPITPLPPQNIAPLSPLPEPTVSIEVTPSEMPAAGATLKAIPSAVPPPSEPNDSINVPTPSEFAAVPSIEQNVIATVETVQSAVGPVDESKVPVPTQDTNNLTDTQSSSDSMESRNLIRPDSHAHHADNEASVDTVQLLKMDVNNNNNNARVNGENKEVEATSEDGVPTIIVVASAVHIRSSTTLASTSANENENKNEKKQQEGEQN